MVRETVSLDSSGRIVIPGNIRKSAKIGPGDKILLEVDDLGNLSAMTPRQAVEKARAILAPYLSEGSLVDTLREMRREDLKRERPDGGY